MTRQNSQKLSVTPPAQTDRKSGVTMSPDAFRHWRERKAYTLDTAARALGVSRRMVAYYEQGARPIPRVVALATRALDQA